MSRPIDKPAYEIKRDIVRQNIPGPHLAQYKLDHSYIESKYVYYHTQHADINFNTVQAALDWLFLNQYDDGEAIIIGNDNVIHADYRFMEGVAISPNEETDELDTIIGAYRAGKGIIIDGDTIHADYNSGNAIKIKDNIIHGDYKEGKSVNIEEEYIHLRYDGFNGVIVDENVIHSSYRSGNAIRIKNDHIHGNYTAGNGIKIKDGTIHLDYTGRNGIKVIDDSIYGAYKAGIGIMIDYNNIIGDYEGGNAILIHGDEIHGNYKGSNNIDINGEYIIGNYKSGVAINISGHVIHGNYIGGTAIEIHQNKIHGVYKPGNAIRIDDNYIHGAYQAGAGISIRGDSINANYIGGVGVRIDWDVISLVYKAGIGIKIEDDVISGNYRGSSGVKVVGDTIEADYHGGIAINITGDVVSAVYKPGIAIRINDDVIHMNYKSGTGIFIDNDRIIGDYKGGMAIDIDDNVINGTYVGENGIFIDGDIINATYIGENGIYVDDDVIEGAYNSGEGINIVEGFVNANYIGENGILIAGDTIYGDYKEGNAIKIEDNVIHGDYVAHTGVKIRHDEILGDYKAGMGIRIKENVISGDYIAGFGILINQNEISIDPDILDIYHPGVAISITAGTVVNANYRAGMGISIIDGVISDKVISGTGTVVAGNTISVDPVLLACCENNLMEMNPPDPGDPDPDDSPDPGDPDPGDPDPGDPDTDCFCHISGLLLADDIVSSITIIREETGASELVPVGEYELMSDAVPKAHASTIDSIAIGPGTTIKIWSEPDFAGEVVLEATGPKLFWNSPFTTSGVTGAVWTNDFDEPFQTMFPQSVRIPIPAADDIHSWGNGSFKVTCAGEPGEPDPSEPTLPECFLHCSGTLLCDKYKYHNYSIIYEPDEVSEIVEMGDYPLAKDALPKSHGGSFDSIAIGEGTTIKFWSEPNFTGEVVLEATGPKLFWNEYHIDRNPDVWENAFSDPVLEALFPVANRIPVPLEDDIHSWGNGSFKVTCAGEPGEPGPDEPDPDEPSLECVCQMSGIFLSDQFEVGKFSKIGDPNTFSELVPMGNYPVANLAYPNAHMHTLDSIVIWPNTHLRIWDGPDYTGNLVLDVHGPKILWNGWNLVHLAGVIDYHTVFEKTFDDSALQAEFPTSVREWIPEGAGMHNWGDNGSLKITCGDSPEPGGPADPDEPTLECFAHCSGHLMLASSIALGGGTTIFIEDTGSELVAAGDYPLAKEAFPKAHDKTFDSIAIGTGTTIKIWSEPDFAGEVVLEATGPKVFLNGFFPNVHTDINLPYADPVLEATFPPSVREIIPASDNMENWGNGSLKITCS